MAVEANFASLFEKLKVEDPWLPPRTWESIPSQSGPLPPLPNSQPPISSSSSVSEATLVRLALNALQGVESSLCSIEKLSAAFFSDPADRTFHQTPSLWYRSSSTHALGKILKSIGRSGFLVFLLHKFVEYFTNLNLNGNSFSLRKGWENSQATDNQNHGGHKVQEEEGPKYSLVNQAFSVAVGKVLEGYICALDTLYASVNVRHSKSTEVSTGVSSGCLTSVVYSGITLLEVYLHTKELRTQIEALGNICNLHDLALCFLESSFEELSYKATMGFHKFFRGGDLLSYLYTQLKVADPAHHALFKFLFLRSCEPYCEFIRSWIFKAEINDPFKEFVVEYIDTLQHRSAGKDGIPIDFPVANITERDGVVVPCFLKDLLTPLIRAGQQLQVLMKLLELREHVFSHRAEPHLFGTSGDTPNIVASLTVDDKLVINSTMKRSFSNVSLDNNDFDDSSTKDGSSHEADIFEPFESSSMSSFEEHTESEQLIEHSNNLVWPKQNYFSALSFSVSTPFGNSLQLALQNGQSDRMESSLQAGTGGHGNFIGCEPNGINDHLSPHLESNWLCAEVESANILTSKGWPVNSARNNAFCIDGDDRDDKRSHLCDSDIKMRKCNTQFFDKFVQHFNESIAINNTSAVDTSNEVQHEKDSTSGLFQLQQFKLTYNGSLLSKNPMLTNNSFFRMMSKTGVASRIDHQQTLPYFDFSSVDDPCMVYVERLSSGFTHEFPENTSSVTNGRGNQDDKQGYGDVLLVDNSKSSYAVPPLELRNQTQDVISTTVSGSSYWESLLGSFSNPNSSGTIDMKLNTSSTFEIPLDFRWTGDTLKFKDFLSCPCRGHLVKETLIKIGVHSFDFLGLGYRVDWPISIILTPAALKIYADIFNFLIQLKLAVFSLTDVWCSLKDIVHLICQKRHPTLHEREVGHFNKLMKLRHQVNHFVSTLQQYVQSQLSHVSWCKFLHSFKHKVKDMMDLESVHMSYLTDSLHICFLSDETKPIASTIENILQCALDFRSCLTGDIWNVGLAEGDLQDKLSKINISQVLGIKETFDKNLKELHLLYLKSPKHGESGLSCFWGYLNYNDYYVNENEMSYYAFSI
ncbi:Gamma-tubulin complex component 6 [Gossypium arboreum]|uniref:Gamma-tubulin complex component n=1 Tax=Gossypium arboreum TaxID=29729 RepID=A0A0B0PKG9_GOSAR|nr:Gamma-tubulin complex component 6 [Gossypium arboreum]